MGIDSGGECMSMTPKIMVDNIVFDHIVFYDGQCRLCHWSVDFIVRRDQGKNFVYCSLHSPRAKELLGKHYDFIAMDSLVLLSQGKLYTRSSAVLTICQQLPGWSRLATWASLLPQGLSDGIYRLVSQYRHLLFPRSPTCRLARKGEEDYFIC